MSPFEPDTDLPPLIVHGGGYDFEIQPLQAPAITYDPNEVCAAILDDLTELEARLAEPAPGQALGRDLLVRVHTAFRDVRRRADAAFQVAVIGDFKRGKSTLVNALLGQKLAPMDVLSQTLTVNHFTWGEQFSGQLIFRDGGRIDLQPADLERSALLSLASHGQAEVSHVQIQTPSDALRDLVLIDTPGTGDLNADVLRTVCETVAASDLLLVVIQATSPLSETERALLRIAVQPCDFSRLYFVVNGIDAINDPGDMQRVHDRIVGAVARDFPGAKVFPLSALDELQRQTGEDRPRPAEAARWEAMFADFRGEMESVLAGPRRFIRADRMIVAAVAALTDLDGRLTRLEEELTRDGAELDRSLARDEARDGVLEAELEAQASTLAARGDALAREAEDWMRQYAGRLRAALESQLPLVTPEQIDRDLQFFISSQAEEALSACIARHEDQLLALSEEFLGDRIRPGAGVAAPALEAARAVYSGPRTDISAVVRAAIDHVTGAGLVLDIGMEVFGRLSSRPGSLAGAGRMKAALANLEEPFGRAATATYRAATSDLTLRLAEVQRARREASQEAVAQARLLRRDHGDRLEAALGTIGEARTWVAGHQAKLSLLKTRTRPDGA